MQKVEASRVDEAITTCVGQAKALQDGKSRDTAANELLNSYHTKQSRKTKW